MYAPAFFSSSERVFQSLFWSSSSCWWTVSCSSGVNFPHWASTLDRGMTASLERAVVVAAAEMERENCLLAALMGRKRRAACIWEEGVREGCKLCELKKRDATERESSHPKAAPAHWLIIWISHALAPHPVSLPNNSLVVHEIMGLHHAQDIIEKRQGTRRVEDE